MATNVSLLGSAGGTVTLPISSANNAAVAQTALQGISDAISAGTLGEVYESASGVPPPTPPAKGSAPPGQPPPPLDTGKS